MTMTSQLTQIQTMIQRKYLSMDDTQQNNYNLLQYDKNLYYSFYIIGISGGNELGRAGLCLNRLGLVEKTKALALTFYLPKTLF